MNNSYEERLKEVHKRLTTAKDCAKDYTNYSRCVSLVNDYVENQQMDREKALLFISEMSREYRNHISICSLGKLEVKNVNAVECNDTDLAQMLLYFRDNILYFMLINAATNMMG